MNLVEKMQALEICRRVNFGIVGRASGVAKKQLVFDFLESIEKMDVFSQTREWFGVENCYTCIFCLKQSVRQWFNFLKKSQHLRVHMIETLIDLVNLECLLDPYFARQCNIFVVSEELIDKFAASLSSICWNRIIFDNFDHFECAKSSLPDSVFAWYMSSCEMPTIVKWIVKNWTQNSLAFNLHSKSSLVLQIASLHMESAPCNITFKSCDGTPAVDLTRWNANFVHLLPDEWKKMAAEECFVCMTPDSKMCQVVCCRHYLCTKCVDNIASTQDSCPFCRARHLKQHCAQLWEVRDLWKFKTFVHFWTTFKPGPRVLILVQNEQVADEIYNNSFMLQFFGSSATRHDKVRRFNSTKKPVVLVGIAKQMISVDFENVSDIIFVGPCREYYEFLSRDTPCNVYFFE